MKRETLFSPCRRYRYTLWREFYPIKASNPPLLPVEGNEAHNYVQFIGLNPSTADEQQDDPTVRRCINYAKAWGFGAMCMTNLFALRATNPGVMLEHDEPIGVLNIHFVTEVARGAGLIICAWGVHGAHLGQDENMLEHLDRVRVRSKLHCLRKTKHGVPGHPLYLRKDLKPVPMFPAIEGLNEA